MAGDGLWRRRQPTKRDRRALTEARKKGHETAEPPLGAPGCSESQLPSQHEPQVVAGDMEQRSFPNVAMAPELGPSYFAGVVAVSEAKDFCHGLLGMDYL